MIRDEELKQVVDYSEGQKTVPPTDVKIEYTRPDGSVDHAGPADLVSFLGISDEDEAARIKQDSYQKMNYLISSLNN